MRSMQDGQQTQISFYQSSQKRIRHHASAFVKGEKRESERRRRRLSVKHGPLEGVKPFRRIPSVNMSNLVTKIPHVFAHARSRTQKLLATSDP